MPPAPPRKIKETQASNLGDAPVHSLLHQQLSVRPSQHYIFIASHVMCSTCSLLFSFVLLSLISFAVHNKLDTSMPYLGEKHAPLFPRMIIVFSSILLSVQFYFQMLPCLALVFHAYFLLRAENQNSITLLSFMFILLRELALLHQVCILL